MGVAVEELGSLPGLPTREFISSCEVLPVKISLQVSSISIIK